MKTLWKMRCAPYQPVSRNPEPSTVPLLVTRVFRQPPKPFANLSTWKSMTKMAKGSRQIYQRINKQIQGVLRNLVNIWWMNKNNNYFFFFSLSLSLSSVAPSICPTFGGRIGKTTPRESTFTQSGAGQKQLLMKKSSNQNHLIFRIIW